MSNLLKSKFFLGVMVAATLFVGALAVNPASASAASCTITTTLRVGSKGAEVACLQAAVGVTADGSFGPKTKAAVKAWQASVGLVADGVFGPKSRAVWMAGSTSMTYPAGCTSSSGFSATTGLSCSTVMTTYPAGCTSNTGFSPTTGLSCGTVVVTNLPAGCTSTSGFSPTTGLSCSGTVVPTTGPLSVSLASDNPASAYIIANQAIADLAHFTFTGTGTVNTIVLQRTGVSDQNTLSNVYLFSGTTRLTDGYSFNNSGQLTMNNLGIAVNGSKTISVRADVANVTNASSLGITLVSFTAAGNPVTTANVAGNQMTYGQGNLASVYLGTNTVTGSPTINAGTSAYTVWSSPVQVNTRAVSLKGANFRVIGSAPSTALANIKLYVDGISTGVLATMGTITGSNYAMFDFSAAPINLSTGTHTVDLRADIVGGSSYTVQVSIQQASDLIIFDPQVAVNIAALGPAGVAFTSNAGATITINAGSASVVIDPTFQVLTNVTGGATNTAIARFKVRGYGEDVKVTTLSVTPVLTSMTPAAAGLANVTVFFNGSQVGSSQNWTSGALTFTLGSQMILPAGADSFIEIRSDLQTTSSVSYTAGSVSANVNVGSSNGQGQTSKTTLNFPGSTVTGNILTVQTGVLAVSKNAGYANQSVNPNTANVKIGSYILQNQSSSESVRVTSLALALTRADGTTALTSTGSAGVYPALTNFSNLKTSETSGSGSTPIQPSAANTFSVNFTLAPGATYTIDVFADTSATAASAQFSTNLVVTSLGASSNVSISQNGNATAVAGQVLTLAAGTVTNPPTLTTGPATTAQQFVPAAGGATNAATARFNLAATGGTATISELKFTVNSQDFSSATTTAATSTGSTVMIPTTVADTAKFAVGDVVQIVAATTNGLGKVTAISANTSVTVYVSVATVGATSALRLVPSTVTSVAVGGVSAQPVNGVAYLTGLNLVVPNGQAGLNVDAMVSYAPVGTNGVTSGSTSRVALESIKYSAGGTTTTLCTAAIATCTTVLAVGGVSAPTMELVGSSPTLALTAPSGVLATGTIEIADVKVNATKGSVTINALPISVTLTNATLTAAGTAANGIIVQDSNGNPVTTTNTLFAANTGGTSTITFTNGYKVDTTQTFKIFLQFATVTNAAGAHTSSASLGLGTADLFSWTDTAGNASATTGTDTAGSAAITKSNRYLDGNAATTTPGFFFSYPTTTVSVSS